MTWTVTIHHIDIGSIGDATVIDARHPGGPGNPAIRRTVLIDGGKGNAAPIVDGYLAGIGVNQVDVIIVTHFDEDHFYGISKLLRGTAGTPARYQHAILYDMGRLPAERDEREKVDQYNKRQYALSEYAKYRQAISTMPATFRHATGRVNSFDIVSWNAATGAAVAPGILTRNIGGGGPRNYQVPHWLLDKDVLWGNGEDGQGGNPWTVQAAAAYAPNRPVLRCIAVNKWVLQNGGGAAYCSNAPQSRGMTQGDVADTENANDNAKSLGFVLEFNNFKYYVAGDLEQPQEDGWVNLNAVVPGAPVPGAVFRLNQTDTMADRVHAMKASHHGAQTASSRTFITRLRPGAAFISTGRGNKFKHPAQRTINVLDGYQEIPPLADANSRNRHPPTPPPPPARAVPHYLTGYQDPVNLLALGGDASQTAGDPAVPTPGHIRLTVTEAESLLSPLGQTYRGTRAALDHVTAGLGLAAPAAAVLDAVAGASATYGAARAVTALLGLPALLASHALAGAASMGDDELAGVHRVGIANAAVNAAAGGAAAVTAAINVF
ncbi:MBL fold metallo-hydrolase, partial [Micromonospora sp. NPDC000207]|uniref:ComEC/Rec2 family competence protein n=1 Tax=Micromonospora sp. NPDC000207 TaxID=3154246 RepID=UPI003320CED2